MQTTTPNQPPRQPDAMREQRCLDEILAALQRHGCELQAVIVLENGSVSQRVRVVVQPVPPA
jgi:hypothetical protein